MTKQKIDVSKSLIVDLYTDYLLEHGEEPPSVYSFAKQNKFTEPEFYQFFGSFKGVEEAFYELLFDRTYEVIEKSKTWKKVDAKEKLLTFYYTFFENLTANRSFVLKSLGVEPHVISLKKLRLLRKSFKRMIHALDIDMIDLKQEQLKKIQERTLEESAWIQLLSTMKFWLDDDSPSFEKTDVFIEKSVNTGFECMNVKPLRSLLDFGKFVLQERSI